MADVNTILFFHRHSLVFTLLAATLLPLWPPLSCLAAEERRIGMVISNNILPYNEAVEGLRKIFSGREDITLKSYLLKDYSNKGMHVLQEDLLKEKCTLHIAVGPEALRFLTTQFSSGDVPVIFSMILDPETVVMSANKTCGISMRIPLEQQLDELSRIFAPATRLGLLFDPKHNSGFYEAAIEKAPARGFQIVPLRVSSKKEIPAVLKNAWKNMDCLWLIPDRTVISESIVAYVIKEALLKTIPSIGFNRFFHDTGALVSFVFNYRDLGVQTANQVLTFLENGSCVSATPVFQTWVNQKVQETLAEKLRLRYPDAAGSRP
jgi:putative ABC transport system substrate-binding protein